MINNEKEIQEMATLLCKRNVVCNTCDCRKGYCPFLEYGHALYNAGYRNTKTMLDDLTDKIMTALVLDEPQRQFLKGVVMGMRMKYGVEEKDNGNSL